MPDDADILAPTQATSSGMRQGEIGRMPARSAGGGKCMPSENVDPTEEEVENMEIEDVLPEGSDEKKINKLEKLLGVSLKF